MKFSQLDTREKITVFVAFFCVFAMIGFAVGATVNVFSGGRRAPKKIVTSAKDNQPIKPTDTEQKPEDSPTEDGQDSTDVQDVEQGLQEDIKSQTDYMTDEMYEVYKVGSDMDSGLYRVVSDDLQDLSYYKVTSDSSARDMDILHERIFTNMTYVQLQDDQYLYLVNASAEPVKDVESYNSSDGVYIAGGYKVGLDMSPGIYHVIPKGGTGYIEVSSTADQNGNILKAYIKEPVTVELKDGQFIFISLCEMKIKDR